MIMRKLPSGIFIDTCCRYIISVQGGWYVPDNYRAELKKDIDNLFTKHFNYNASLDDSYESWYGEHTLPKEEPPKIDVKEISRRKKELVTAICRSEGKNSAYDFEQLMAKLDEAMGFKEF